MVPFCRTPSEAEQVLEEMAKHDLVRGEEDLKIYMMCEIPSNVILAEEFAKHFDGFSIGSNDLTQLILGLDRDSVLNSWFASSLIFQEKVSHIYDERNDAVKSMIHQVIQTVLFPFFPAPSKNEV